jgi:hypothetical protein
MKKKSYDGRITLSIQKGSKAIFKLMHPKDVTFGPISHNHGQYDSLLQYAWSPLLLDLQGLK